MALGACGIGSDEGQVDVGRGEAGELDLCLFGGFLEPLHCHLVSGEVDAGLCAVAGDDPVDYTVVKVVAAQMGVAVGGENLENAVAHVENADVEGAAAEVVNHDLLIRLLVDAVCQSGCRGFVDYTENFESGDLAGVLGGLTLAVVEVGGNGYDRLGDGRADVAFCVSLQLLKDHRGDFLGSVALAVNGDLFGRAHIALDRDDGAVRVGDGLTLGSVADKPFAGFAERDDGRSCSHSFGVGDNGGFAAFHDGDAGVGCSEVYTYDFRHFIFLQLFLE